MYWMAPIMPELITRQQEKARPQQNAQTSSQGSDKYTDTNPSVIKKELAEGQLSVRFTIDVGGPGDFLDQLLNGGAEVVDQTVQFDLQMPAGATSDPDDVARRLRRHVVASTLAVRPPRLLTPGRPCRRDVWTGRGPAEADETGVAFRGAAGLDLQLLSATRTTRFRLSLHRARPACEQLGG